MKVYLEGNIVANKLEENRETKEKFRLLQLYQVSDDDEAELVKIKVFDLTFEKKSGEFSGWVSVKQWNMNNKGGFTCRLIEFAKVSVVSVAKTVSAAK